MEGLLPISLTIGRVAPDPAGAALVHELTHMSRLFTELDDKLESVIDLFRPLFINIVDLLEGYRGTSLRVYETNPDLLDHIEATRWAVAQFVYSKFNDLLGICSSIRSRVGGVRTDLAGIAFELTAFGNAATGLLRAILGQLVKGITLVGLFTLVIRQPDMVPIITALNKLTMDIAGLSWWDVEQSLIPGLDALTRFVTALGNSLSKLSADMLKFLPNLTNFITVLGALALAIAKMDASDIWWMDYGLDSLEDFVTALGDSLSKLSADVLNAIPKLTDFVSALGALGMKLGAMKWDELLFMGVALYALATFVESLAEDLKSLGKDIVGSMDKFGAFIEKLKDMSLAFAALRGWDFAAMAGGLALVALFVYGVVYALNQLSEGAVKAIPDMAKLMGALASLAGTMAGLGWEKLGIMALGFLLIAGFVWALAAAAKWAGPELKALAVALGALEQVFGGISTVAGGAWEAIKGVGGDLFGGGTASAPAGAAPATATSALAGLTPPTTLPASAALPASVAPAAAPPPAATTAAAPAGFAPPSPETLAQLTAGAAPGGPASVDQSVSVNGGINVTINADKLEADASKLLSDQLIAAIQSRLGDLRAQQDFRTGVRA
jgi:hypothetical protein